MKIIRANIIGFCAGVRRAVLAVEKALTENKKGNGYTLGPLIHNPAALKKLSEHNLKILDEKEIETLQENDTVIIRAHGIPPEVDGKIRRKITNVVNATCPLVTKSQQRAAEYAGQGYVIFFAGDKNHGEVIGIEGYAKEGAEKAGKELNFILIRDEKELRSEAEKLVAKKVIQKDSKIVLLSQTTFSIQVFSRLEGELKSIFPQALVISSICPATHERQESLVDLCKEVEGVIVIGGRNSANTNRLFTTARKLCKHVVLIENPDEIKAVPEDFFSLSSVGITAGASTPDYIIDAVERSLSERACQQRF